MTDPSSPDPSVLASFASDLPAAALDGAGQSVVDEPAARIDESGAAVVLAGAAVTLPVEERLSSDEEDRIALALRAGMQPRDVAFAVFELRHGRPAQQGPHVPVMAPDLGMDPAQLAPGDDEQRLAALAAQIAPLERDYKTQLQAEWEIVTGLNLDTDFGGTLDGYRERRPLYVIAGYRDPARTILPHITHEIFLGIGVTVHELMLARLKDAEARLTAQGVSLTEMAQLIGNDVGVFDPRYQKGSRVISNHALALAIDIDPQRNPQIKDPKVIKILDDVTGMDFGSRLTEMSYALQKRLQDIAKASGEDPGSALGELEQQVTELQDVMTTASGTLREWLDAQLNREAAYQARAAADQEDFAAALLAMDNAEAAGDPAAISAARRNAARIAERTRADAAEYHQDAQIANLVALRKALGQHGQETVEHWRSDGILNLPLSLVEALIGAGLGWGGEYQNTKDLMHFELSDTRGRPIIPPDSAPLGPSSLFPGFPP
jgi:hypothetical protein